MPSYVKSIAASPFYECTSLNQIKFESFSSLYVIEPHAFEKFQSTNYNPCISNFFYVTLFCEMYKICPGFIYK